jgi:hypothetical protein
VEQVFSTLHLFSLAPWLLHSSSGAGLFALKHQLLDGEVRGSR